MEYEKIVPTEDLATPGVKDISALTKMWYRFKHRKIIKNLTKGDVYMPKGSASSGLMGEITAATNKEIGLLRISGLRVLRLGKSDNSLSTKGAEKIIAHTHPGGNLHLSETLVEINGVYHIVGDMPVLRKLGQKHSVVIGPTGTGKCFRVTPE